jgi:hypothetical protein
MVGNSTIEEGGVGVVDDLLKDEVLEVKTRRNRRVGSRIAGSELRALGHGVVVGAPDELDGVTDGSVDGEGDVTEDTLGRCNVDDVSLATLGGRFIGRSRVRRHRRVLGLALLNTVVVGVTATPPAVASRTVDGRRGTVLRGGAVGVCVRRRTPVLATVGIVATTIAVTTATIGGGRGRRTPSARWRDFISGPRVAARRMIQVLGVHRAGAI